jgi:uncharacterized protein YecA (UPF0149 family)
MQEMTLKDGRKLREFFGAEDEEAMKKKMTEMHQKALELGVTEVRQVKLGRNSPCPCGSGKKFKKCCMCKVDQGPEVVSEDGENSMPSV